MALPKLNLRDLFWLALVAAMGLSWWQDHRRMVLDAQARRIDNLRLTLKIQVIRNLMASEGFKLNEDESILKIERRYASPPPSN